MLEAGETCTGQVFLQEKRCKTLCMELGIQHKFCAGMELNCSMGIEMKKDLCTRAEAYTPRSYSTGPIFLICNKLSLLLPLNIKHIK